MLSLLFNEFVYGGHLTSIGTSSIVFTSAVLLDIKITWDFLVVIYLSSYIFLLYDRFKDLKEDFLTNPERTLYLKKYSKVIPLLISCLILSVIGIILCFNDARSLVFCFLLLLLGLFYSLFFKKITRKIIAFKTFFISFLACPLIIFLFFYYSIPFSFAGFLIFSFVFLRMFINTNFFDIKDMESDKKKGLLTLPLVLEKKYLLHLLCLITFIAPLPILFGFYLGFFPIYSLILFLTIPYTFFYFNYFKRSRNEKSYYIFIDGELILWTFFILLGKNLL